MVRNASVHRVIPLNCPYCGARVAYERTEGEAHYYRCETCGPLVMPPDAPLRRVMPDESS